MNKWMNESQYELRTYADIWVYIDPHNSRSIADRFTFEIAK